MLKAEYIEYMEAFRVYGEEKPQQTMAYADDAEEAKNIAERLGEEIFISPQRDSKGAEDV